MCLPVWGVCLISKPCLDFKVFFQIWQYRKVKFIRYFIPVSIQTWTGTSSLLFCTVIRECRTPVSWLHRRLNCSPVFCKLKWYLSVIKRESSCYIQFLTSFCSTVSFSVVYNARELHPGFPLRIYFLKSMQHLPDGASQHRFCFYLGRG